MSKRSFLWLSKNALRVMVVLAMTVPSRALPLESPSVRDEKPLVVEIIGDAYDFTSGDLLYRELHLAPELQDDGGVRKQIDYQTPDGRVFAQKQLTYLSPSMGYRYHPQVQQMNFDNGRLLRLDWQSTNSQGTDSSVWQLQRKAQHKGPLDTVELPSRQGWVVDAGFDAWMFEHWDKLKTGETQSFSFLALTRASWVQLQAKRRSCSLSKPLPAVGNPSSSVEGFTCIRIEPKNRILRWLVDAIDLVYEEPADVRVGQSPKPRLVRFSGLGNLTDERGDGMKVVIDYVYPESAKVVVQ